VLKKALPDMAFFGLVFSVSVFAFANMLFIQLGANMLDFKDQTNSLISLGRALFGDFDIDTIIENSPNYMNTAFYLAYLFVAVFILLSMFLAILGEAQANLRDDQRDERQKAHDLGEEIAPEYGIITEGAQLLKKGTALLPFLRKKDADQEDARDKKEPPPAAQATAVDRIEARQLEMSDNLKEVIQELASLRDAGTRISGTGLPSRAVSPVPSLPRAVSPSLAAASHQQLEAYLQAVLKGQQEVLEGQKAILASQTARRARSHHRSGTKDKPHKQMRTSSRSDPGLHLQESGSIQLDA